MHKSRQRRNTKRSLAVAKAQGIAARKPAEPGSSRKAIEERYPHPPVYAYEMGKKNPDQPACYTVWYSPIPGLRYAKTKGEK